MKKTPITAVTFRVLPVNLTVVVQVALFKRWNMFIMFTFWVTFSTMWVKPATSYCSVASDWKYFTLNSWAKGERRNLTTKSSGKSGGTTTHFKGTRLAPTRYKCGYNPSKWRFFGYLGDITLLIIGVITLSITGRGPPPKHEHLENPDPDSKAPSPCHDLELQECTVVKGCQDTQPL